ncbi:hypothetical protein [Haloprofundus halophilus]|uniref:hypothetical protein n=1 Tax=Haloprofundus halophilus TaxID=2283527 RepID=UPI000E4334E9|nr:hypothetical protein [Haloprofundus halophilus]
MSRAPPDNDQPSDEENQISRQRNFTPDAEMGLVGGIIGVLIAVLTFPLLPFYLLFRVVDSLVGDDETNQPD